MTKEKYKQALKEGSELFKKIVTELNTISDKFVRKDDICLQRRSADWEEICIALFLSKKLESGPKY